MTLWESGLPKFWMNGVIPRNECSAKTKPRRKNQTTRRLIGPIKLNDLNGVFLILGIGTGLATFVFLIEKIIHFRRRQLP
jgi:ionotropic glutamate receptor